MIFCYELVSRLTTGRVWVVGLVGGPIWGFLLTWLFDPFSIQVIAAEGEQKASRALREASDIIGDSPAALQLRYLQVINLLDLYFLDGIERASRRRLSLSHVKLPAGSGKWISASRLLG